MIRALSTAATGLEAQQANIERISNDLANVNTDAYKRSRNEFQDLMYETVKEAGGSLGAASQSPVGIQTGMGVKVGAAHKIFEQGPARVTSHPYDVMIEGRGFMPVQMPNGEMAYTRSCAFKLDRAARLMLANGAYLVPQITIPQTATNVTIAPGGAVQAILSDGSVAELGQLQLASFLNEEGLSAMGGNVYRPTLASGQAILSVPGENGTGSLSQGALEGSNVNVANSMVEMISTQRAYEMGTKVMGVVDNMLGATTAVIK